MLLSSPAIERFVNILTGQTGLSIERGKQEIDELFKMVGVTPQTYDECFNGHADIKANKQYKSSHFKLFNYTRIKIEELNGTSGVLRLLENLLPELGSLKTVSEVLQYMNEVFLPDNYEVVKIEEDNVLKISSLDDSMVSYGCYFEESKKGQFVLIREHCDKCVSKIKAGDYSGAITNSRSLLEQILREVQKAMNPNSRRGYDGKLTPLLEEVLKQLKITEGLVEKPKKGYEFLEKGFVSLTEGISLLRHGMSDAHNISHPPTQKDALLAVNTSKTLSSFIVEHYFEKYVIGQGA